MYSVLEKARYRLSHYLTLMTGCPGEITVETDPEAFVVKDPAQDDAYKIDVEAGKGIISASNERAALIAVYHLLRDNGCMFVRPGAASERVPKKAIADIASKENIVAAHRFRGICIEGSCNIESTLELIEWMPKVGYNCYFMQFREGYQFYLRWYTCMYNTVRMPNDYNLDVCRDILTRVVRAAHENGLMYHAVGHGFTCECFGIPGLGWIEEPDEIWPEKYRFALAMRNGVRDMQHHIPLESALCYSNPEVQKIVASSAADYIAAHPEIDYVHFWLDDGTNNKCECDECRKLPVADHYIQLLNVLDDELNKRDCKTKIVFLAYQELLWPPLKSRLNNPDRFTFMFAPIQRSFSEPFFDPEKAPDLPEYKLNHMQFPTNNAEMSASLKAWNKYRAETGMDFEDSLDFDYYSRGYFDPGQFIQARVLYEDCKNLKRYGMNGILNCQPERVFDHAAFSEYVMGRVLTDTSLSFEAITEEYFRAAFGEGWEAYRDRCMELSRLSENICDEKRFSDVSALKNADFTALEALLEKPLPETPVNDLTTSESKKIMVYMADLTLRVLRLIEAARGDDKALVEKLYAETKEYLNMRECEFKTVTDVRHLNAIMQKIATGTSPSF